MTGKKSTRKSPRKHVVGPYAIKRQRSISGWAVVKRAGYDNRMCTCGARVDAEFITAALNMLTPEQHQRAHELSLKNATARLEGGDIMEKA